jgi:hypothetical protein
VGNWNTSDFSDEDMDQDVQQDIAAAAAQSVGIDMGNYDFGGYDPSGTDFTGVSNKSAASAIANSFMADPNAAARTAMAIRQSYPVYSGSMRPALDAFINRYTTTRGPLTRDAYNRAYDITRTNLGGINTLGYDTAKALQRIGIGSGQVKSANPTAGRLTGTVFKDGVISKDGVMQGVPSDVYYGAEDLDNKYEGLPRYSDKGYLGPDSVPYSSPEERALNRAYDQYMNPYNELGKQGYNPDVTNLGAGEVRPGLQSGIFSDMSGTPTRLGPVATYDRNYSGMDNLAMTAFGGMGHLARALTNKVTGIEGQPLPAAALAPTPEMVAQGQTSGGFFRSLSQIPGQIKQGIESLVAPNVPAPTPTQIGSVTPSQYETRADIIGRLGTVGAPALGSVFEVDGRSFLAGKNGPIELSGVSLSNFRSENPAEATIDKGQGQILGVQDYFQNQFAAPANQFETLNDKMNLGLSDSRLGSPSGIENTGLFGENPKAAGFRDLGGMIKSVVDGENLPDNQNMYGPGMPDQTPLTPDELNDILAPSGMELGRGPATANQLAFDTTGMTRYGNSYVGNNYGIMDKAANSIPGLADTLRSMGIDIATPPTAKIYSSPTSSNAFSRLIGR